MENTQENNVNHCSKENNSNSVNTKHGINNWMLMFLTIFVANFVIENYLSYGIRMGPIQMTHTFILFMKDNWWMYGIFFLSYLLQLMLCFLTEKCLALGILSERVGMTVHIFNSLLLFNIATIVFTIYDFNPVAGVGLASHVFLMSVKFWGYIYTNMVHRQEWKRKLLTNNCELNGKAAIQEANAVTDIIKYPQNVTLFNLLRFMLGTGGCQYSPSPKKKPRQYRKILIAIFTVPAIYFVLAFIIYQYLIPEADKAVLYIDNQEYVKVLGSILKLVFPVHIVWLLYFYFYCFGFYLPIFGWVWGTEDIIVGQDWWNSENSTIFWVKWNYQVHIWFKECFFLPVLRAGYSKSKAAFVVAFVSGILHEYLVSFPCRTGYGLALGAMLAQIPLAYLTSSVAKRYGSKWGNMLVWLNLVVGHTFSAVLIYYSYVKNAYGTDIK